MPDIGMKPTAAGSRLSAERWPDPITMESQATRNVWILSMAVTACFLVSRGAPELLA
jgi:hypothetical protein